MSKTLVIHPIDACFLKAEGVIKPEKPWQAENPKQAAYLERLLGRREDLKRFSPKELRSWVDKNANVLNKILKDEGFAIQLKPFDSPEDFGVVSILDVLVEWLVSGTISKVFHKGKNYPAVSMKATEIVDDKSVSLLDVFTSSSHPHPVVALNTKSGDRVYMTIVDKGGSSVEGLELGDRIADIRDGLGKAQIVDSVIFPMIDLDQTEDISWLKNMWTTDEKGCDWAVAQALQQTKFKMNEKGARVKSAVAIGMLRCSSVGHMPRTIIIDQPFFLWIERPGLSHPLMCAYLNVENWKNPEGLDKI